MEVRFNVKFNKNEADALAKAVEILDRLINDMEKYKTREVITKMDRTYSLDFIDNSAGMMMEFINGVDLG